MLDTIPSPLSKYGKIPIAKTDDIIPESEAINNCVPISRGEKFPLRNNKSAANTTTFNTETSIPACKIIVRRFFSRKKILTDNELNNT
ncbi:Uncharacterised protein [Streptococcus pneumoniae]|nr:Uncharacterised protein [Streptococcus pneumoniae]